VTLWPQDCHRCRPRRTPPGVNVTSTPLTQEQIVARNLAAVDAHFHNENPQDIDEAIDLYDDSIVWEAPARGVLLHGEAAGRTPTSCSGGPSAPSTTTSPPTLRP
jgi:hypothetical protein